LQPRPSIQERLIKEFRVDLGNRYYSPRFLWQSVHCDIATGIAGSNLRAIYHKIQISVGITENL